MIHNSADDNEPVYDLYQRIRDELVALFGHNPREAAEMLERFRVKYPWLKHEVYSHDGAAAMALRIHYDIYLDLNANGLEFLDWRIPYFEILKDRMK